MFRAITCPKILIAAAHYCAAWDGRAAPPLSGAWAGLKASPNAAPKRRAEFAAGRRCAAEAIRLLRGDPGEPIGVNPDRSPRWPEGLVGSITHTPAFAAAAVASSKSLRGLGIDSESLSRASAAPAIRRLAAGDAEREILAALGWEEASGLLLLFSAKESFYKCLSPLVKKFFDFGAAELCGIDAAGTFRLRLTRGLGAGFKTGFTALGRFARSFGHVHTGVEIFQ